MKNELIINVTKNVYRIALLQDGQLVEYHIDERNNPFTVGDIYLGAIKKVVPSLNACFIDIGYKKDAFLHYSDLGPQFNALKSFISKASSVNRNSTFCATDLQLETEIDKLGKMEDVLCNSTKILVQIAKEPISTKGPRLSTELSLAGRYMILMPFNNEIIISKKIINQEERKRLLRLLSSIKPNNFGVIIRTAAQGKEAAKLDKDLKDLTSKWESGIYQLKTATTRDKVIGEMNRASSILRDMLNESFDKIVVDDEKTYREIYTYIQKIAPEKIQILKKHQGHSKIFEHFGIEKQLKVLFGKTVTVENGGHLVIEHTEAMHVIDVNSGKKTTISDDQSEMAMQVNLAAAKEIARQLRLRDMGGIISIDFIDLRNAEKKRELLQTMKDLLHKDRSKATVLPLSRFGVMQITRQRVRPEMSIVTSEACPSCHGTGKIDASIAISEQISEYLHLVFTHQNEKRITICLHPYLYSYFTKGYISQRMKWFMKYRKWVNLIEDSSLGVTEFKFLNKKNEIITLQQ